MVAIIAFPNALCMSFLVAHLRKLSGLKLVAGISLNRRCLDVWLIAWLLLSMGSQRTALSSFLLCYGAYGMRGIVCYMGGRVVIL